MAILISCSGYDDRQISSLNYADDDLELISNCLINYCCFKQAELIKITKRKGAKRPNRAEIISAIISAKEEYENIDNLVFYYSGHGFHSANDDNDYIVPADANVGALEATSISLHLICKLIKNLNAKNNVLFIDACKSIIYSKNVKFESFDIGAEYFKGMAVFYSCGLDQDSFEIHETRSSIFSYCLSLALSEIGKCRTIKELSVYMCSEVPALCKKYGKPIQKPYVSIEHLGIIDISLFNEPSINIFKEIKHHVKYYNLKLSENAIIALDFGSYRTLLAIPAVDGEAVYVPFLSSTFIPTVISFDKNLNYCVGEDAVKKIGDPNHITIQNFKRYVGLDKKYVVFNYYVSAEILAILFIKSILNNAKEYFGVVFKQIMISVPGNFKFNQWNAFEAIIHFLGITLIRSIGEPCCAGLNFPKISDKAFGAENIVIVLDIGGGTSDLSVMDAGKGVLQTLYVSGDNELGGIDYDDVVYTHLKQKVNDRFDDIVDVANVDARLHYESEKVKKALAKNENIEIFIPDIERKNGELEDFILSVNRQDFRNMTESLNNRIECLLNDAEKFCRNSRHRRPRYILLGGLGSKIFTIAELLVKKFPNAEVIDTYCENAVITGLCKYAGVLDTRISKSDLLLLDCMYYGINLLFDNKPAQCIIGEYATIPTKRTYVPNAADGVLIAIEAFYRDGSHELLYSLEDDPTLKESLKNGFQLIIEVDTNRMMLLRIENDELDCVFSLQINQLYRNFMARRNPMFELYRDRMFKLLEKTS